MRKLILTLKIKRKNVGDLETDMKDFKINNFNTIQDFMYYAEVHYLPLLDRLSEKNTVMTEEERVLLSFLHDDMTSMVNNYNQSVD